MKQKTLYNTVSFEGENEIFKIFSVESFSIGEVFFSGKIIVAVVRFRNIDSLSKSWKEINSYITGHYISTINDEFAKWNFYMFYVSNTDVAKQLKYEIENNKFSSRKIVVDNYKKDLTKKNIDHIISEHITNDNIVIYQKEEAVLPFNKNNKLSGIIDKMKFGKGKKDKDSVLYNTLDQIEQKYKK